MNGINSLFTAHHSPPKNMIDYSIMPASPGCYIYKDEKNNIIYIGKAKDLKKRVSSYFQKRDHDRKTLHLINNIHSIDYIVTDNEIEALILENTLIKKHKPKYNIDLKDSRRYASIEITGEDFPRLLVARTKHEKGEYYGPFVSGQKRDYLIKLLRKIFKLRTCKRLPKKACLRYHIKLCDAPCTGTISREDYSEKIKNVRYVLKNNTDLLIEDLKGKMDIASRELQFEKAIEYREQIYALQYMSQKQKMERNRTYNEDIIDYIIHEEEVFLLLFNIDKGALHNKSDFIFPYIEDFFEEFLVQYYSEHEIPEIIIVPCNIENSVKDFLSYKKGKKVTVTVPKSGEKKHLLDLVKKNCEISFFGDMIKVEELQKKLHLNDMPSVIECFDISHLSGTFTVGAMVQFRNGKPDKNNYRRFKIKSPEAIQDDFTSIAEVVRRRYTRLYEEGSPMPDLIIIDGGKGQLSAALEELNKLSLKIPVISIAKKFEEIYFPGLSRPLRLGRTEKALLFIQEIRDETHRFAITYNRKLRSLHQ